MSHPLYVAFVWHQHQPLYRSPIPSTGSTQGRYLLPWVRLHGIKDYLDLILMLDKYPKLHQTVNLVPSLIIQLEDYIAGRAFDPYLELLLKPVETMNSEQLGFIIDRFFDGHYPNLIAPHARYRQLFEEREQQGRNWCLQYWNAQDYSDLLAWHNLAWFDPMFQEDPEIQGWIQQQQGFTLSDRQRIYIKQQHILSRIIPQHAKMQQSGQLEVITSPYTHPIMPLLVNDRSARVACPGLPLPKYGFHWENDVVAHLQKAKIIYSDRFQRDPRGLWPSEQSVSPAVLPYIQKEGFRWTISGEGVLGWSLGKPFGRDQAGNILDPEVLYRPYRIEGLEGDLSIVFRDHRLSDLIGFTYSTMEANEAAKDLIGHLETIRNRLAQDQPWLVTIALDGENCWEYYPEDGRLFLDSLYSRLQHHPGLRLVTVSEYLDQFPPTAVLPVEQLHSGSWIESNFTTWIGDPVKNRAWELLAQARQLLEKHPRAHEAAWESLWAAEGSDWFWWFGEGHSSVHDAVFDQLFREHLQSIYLALGEIVPTALLYPLEEHDGMGDHAPQGFIHPTINGRPSEREWSLGGRIEVAASRGTMHRASTVRKIWYGYDHFHLYVRLDFSSAMQRPQEVGIFWFYPSRTTLNSPLPFQKLPAHVPLTYLYRHGLVITLPKEKDQSTGIKFLEAGEYHSWREIPHQAKAALDSCLEVSIPWLNLGAQPGQEAQFLVLTAEGEIFQETVPPQTTIAVKVP